MNGPGDFSTYFKDACSVRTSCTRIWSERHFTSTLSQTMGGYLLMTFISLNENLAFGSSTIMGPF